MRHKRILDAAADNPNASVEELASRIPTATAELVERVLDEHGDPAATDESVDTADAFEDEKPSSGGTSDNNTDTTNDGHIAESTQTTATEPDDGDTPVEPNDTEVTAKQRAVLEYVAMDPSATQREIGDRLGVSAATVSNRVNAIDGFEWSDRNSFVERLFAERSTIRDDGAEEQDVSSAVKAVDSTEDHAESDPESSGATESTSAEESNSEPAHQPDSANAAVDDDTDQNTTDSETEQRRLDDDSLVTVEQLQALESRLRDLEQRMDDESKQTAIDHPVDNSHSVIDDPDLLHKTVQLWLEDERFSKAEEAALLRALFS